MKEFRAIGSIDAPTYAVHAVIDDFEDYAAVAVFAFFGLDGDARIVADALVHARQRVEKRGLACIGIADQGDDGSAQCNHVRQITWVPQKRKALFA